jgi:hypothetical protein
MWGFQREQCPDCAAAMVGLLDKRLAGSVVKIVGFPVLVLDQGPGVLRRLTRR